MWYRSDLDKWRYSPDGTTIKDLVVPGKSILEMTAEELASKIEAQTDIDYLALLFENVFSVDLSAKIFSKMIDLYGDTGVDKISRILSNDNISALKAIKILKSPYLSADYTQRILYKMAENKYIKGIAKILSGDAEETVMDADKTYSGVNRFYVLDLNGHVYTADGQPHVIIAYEIKDSVGTGSIVKTATGGAGGSTGTPPGKGGNGGGGLIILAYKINVPTISADGEDGENGDINDVVEVRGGNGGVGNMIVVSTDTPGEGGKGGSSTGVDNHGNGGGGGNGYIADPYGIGGSITLTTYDTLYELYLDVVKGIIDWWIVNVTGKTPTTTKDIPDIKGAGGGGGSEADGAFDCGGGGGSGGQVIIIADNVTISTITAKGGKGGNGGNEGSYDSGGGGGGGGIVYVAYVTNASISTIDVSGGTGGSGDYAGDNGTAGTYRVEAI